MFHDLPKVTLPELHLGTQSFELLIFFFKILFIYSWETGRGRSRFHAGRLIQDSIPGLQDHTPGCRRRLTAAPLGLPLMCTLKPQISF